MAEIPNYPIELDFVPKPDITVFELAQSVALIKKLFFDKQLYGNIYENNLPKEDFMRHFEIKHHKCVESFLKNE